MERRLSHKKFFMIMGLSILFTLAGVLTATAGGPLTLEQVKAELEKYKGSSLVITSWGGSYQDAQRKAYYEPFEKEFGIKIIEDSPAAISKVMAMVKAKKVTWDIVDGGAYKLDDLGGNRGFLEKMDYNIIDAGDVDPFFVSEWYMSTISWCETLGYRTDIFPGDKAPTSAVDFWDVKKFPGRRAMRDNPIYNIPLALLADGVPKDKIYPLTEDKIKRAFKKLDEIKPHVNVWWTQGAQPPQLLTDKEVVMSTGWNGRIASVQKEGVPVAIIWEGAQMVSDAWYIPKGAEKKDLAMLFIAWATFPENNWRLSQYIDYGPVNTKSLKYLPKEILARMPLTHADKMIKCDFSWWSTQYVDMLDRWREWKLQ
jgi:putative spermidine/putrescine transport system substrate-binding protein